jgi:hypothetical protein
LSTELDEICEREHECTCLAVSIIFQLEVPNLQEIINSWLLGIVPTIYRTFVHTPAHMTQMIVRFKRILTAKYKGYSANN